MPFHSIWVCWAVVPRKEGVARLPFPYDLIKMVEYCERIFDKSTFRWLIRKPESIFTCLKPLLPVKYFDTISISFKWRVSFRFWVLTRSGEKLQTITRKRMAYLFRGLIFNYFFCNGGPIVKRDDCKINSR